MQFSTRIIPHTLRFKTPAGTSRGVYRTHDVWYIVAQSQDDPARFGIGECAPLPDLSCDALPGDQYMHALQQACRYWERLGHVDTEALRGCPSILFGLETAARQLDEQRFALWDTPFSRGETGIPINGLIWMADYEGMLKQVEQKLSQGFECIKLKIGAIDFARELALIRSIREHFSEREITVRVDANGAFSVAEAREKLQRLADLGVHSIEQPIRAGQWEAMAALAENAPLGIALDEELIGCNELWEKQRLLQTIRPQYIVLKPSLHGGFSGCSEWIALAQSLHIGWWVTSALESNIGLNSIAQWCATLDTVLPQGLGTGMLYHNNTPIPLSIAWGKLWFSPHQVPKRLADVFPEDGETA